MISTDIETAPLPEEQLKSLMPEFQADSRLKDPEKIAQNIAKKEGEWKDRAALSPITGRVIAIGSFNERSGYWSHIDADYESELLKCFWGLFRAHSDNPIICGWNIKGFDIPFLIKRSWANRVHVPSGVTHQYKGRTYLSERFVDLMEVWQLGNHKEKYTSLDTACQHLGMQGKIDLGDRLPHEVLEEDPELFDTYLKDDVIKVNDIANIIL